MCVEMLDQMGPDLDEAILDEEDEFFDGFFDSPVNLLCLIPRGKESGFALTFASNQRALIIT